MLVTIPAGTQSDSLLRLGVKGLPLFGGGKRGNLYLSLHVHIQEKLSAAERRLFAKLRELDKQTSSADATTQRPE